MLKTLFFLFKKNNAILPALLGLIGVGLIIAGFFVPPIGYIDGSVLQGSGIIFAFTTLFKIESIIESVAEGRSLILKHGETEIQLKHNDDENE